MVYGVPLGAKWTVIASFAFNAGGSDRYVTVKSTLNAWVTAEVTCWSLHVLNKGSCGCITKNGRKSTPHSFGANFQGVSQHHVQLRYTLFKEVWNGWRFAFATAEIDGEHWRARWLYDPFKYGPELHIWWPENCRTVKIELHWHDIWQWIHLRNLPSCGTSETETDIVPDGKLHNGAFSRRSKQRPRVPSNVWHVRLYCFQNSPLLHRRQSGRKQSEWNKTEKVCTADFHRSHGTRELIFFNRELD